MQWTIPKINQNTPFGKLTVKGFLPMTEYPGSKEEGTPSQRIKLQTKLILLLVFVLLLYILYSLHSHSSEAQLPKSENLPPLKPPAEAKFNFNIEGLDNKILEVIYEETQNLKDLLSQTPDPLKTKDYYFKVQPSYLLLEHYFIKVSKFLTEEKRNLLQGNSEFFILCKDAQETLKVAAHVLEKYKPKNELLEFFQ